MPESCQLSCAQPLAWSWLVWGGGGRHSQSPLPTVLPRRAPTSPDPTGCAVSSRMRRLAPADDPGRSPTGSAGPGRGMAPVSVVPVPCPACRPRPRRPLLTAAGAAPHRPPLPRGPAPQCPPGGWALSQDVLQTCLAGRSCHQRSPVSSTTPGLAPQRGPVPQASIEGTTQQVKWHHV